MNIYDCWIDGSGNSHLLSEMTDDYIWSCLKQLGKWKRQWGHVRFDDLSGEELQRIADVGQKAWYVVNAERYITAFNAELTAREAYRKVMEEDE